VGYFGAGVGGSIIGFGANIAMTDDLYKSMEAALSDATQSTTKSWKQSAHDSRKEKNCPEIYIGTRWTKDDIIGEAIESGKLARIIQIKALDENNKTFCDDVKSTEEYLSIKEEIEPSIFNAEYQQEPIELEGLLLPRSRLRFDDLSTLTPSDFVFRFGVGDPADKGGDKYAAPFLGVQVIEGRLSVYVMDAICNTDGIIANTPAILGKCKSLMIDNFLIEKNGVGLASVVLLAQQIAQHSATTLSPFTSHENKEVRILSNYEFIEKYFVFNSGAVSKEYETFVKDLTSYVKQGKNSHKMDCIDVLSTAAAFVKIKYSSILYKNTK